MRVCVCVCVREKMSACVRQFEKSCGHMREGMREYVRKDVCMRERGSVYLREYV